MPAVSSIRRIKESTTSKVRVDADAGIIYGVRILGPKSKNGYGYSESARRGAVKKQLYERAPINFSHVEDPATRPNDDQVAYIYNVHFKEEDGGVYGDVQVYLKHPMGGYFLERAERNSEKFGLSHVADGEFGDSGKEVEDITDVLSVDIVGRPATNTSLFESEDNNVDNDQDPKPPTETPATKKKAVDMLAEMELDGEGSVAAVLKKAQEKLPTFQEMELDSTGEDPKDAVIGILAESLNVALDLLPDSVAPGAPAPDVVEGDDEDKTAIEKLGEQITTMQKSQNLFNTCISEGVAPTQENLQTLSACNTDKELREAIRSLPESRKGLKPTLTLHESDESDREFPFLEDLVGSKS